MNKLDYPYASELNPLLYQMSKDDIEFSEASELHVNAMDNLKSEQLKFQVMLH